MGANSARVVEMLPETAKNLLEYSVANKVWLASEAKMTEALPKTAALPGTPIHPAKEIWATITPSYFALRAHQYRKRSG